MKTKILYLVIGFVLGVLLVGGVCFMKRSPEINPINPINPVYNGTNPQPIVTSGENPKPGDQVHGLPAEPAAVAARKDLAAKLAIGEGSIVILSVKEATWNDSCLGLGQANESCLQALTPGFKVELLASGKSYFYRTDKTGAVVRMETI